MDQHRLSPFHCLTVRKRSHHHLHEIKKHRSFQNTIVLMNLLTNAFGKRLQRKYFVVPMPLFAKGCADPAIIATHCEDFILDLTIAVCQIKPFVCNGCSAKNPCRLIKPTSTAHPLHTGNINHLWNQEQVLTFRLLTLLLWMNWQPSHPGSLHMILRNHPEIALSEKTLYNYIESELLV